jgi:capsular exopolysaccharide synthesis family protein
MIEVKLNSGPPAVPSESSPAALATLTPARPPALSATPDAIGLLKALRRRWWIAIGLGLIVAALAGAAAYHVVPPAKYTARATLHVATNPKYIIFDPKERLADYRTYQRTQVAMARSQFVLSNALKRPDVLALPTIRTKTDPGEWLGSNIRIDFPDSSEVLEISLSGDRPRDLAVLVNATVDSYLKLVVAEEQREREARLTTLRTLWDRYQRTLQERRTELRKLAESVGSVDKNTLSMAQISKMQHRDLATQEHMRVGFELRKSETELELLRNRVREASQFAVSQELVDAEVEDHPAIQELARDYRRLEAQYNSVVRRVRALSDPSLVAIQRQYSNVRRNLEEARARLREQVAENMRNEAAREDREALDRLQAQVALARSYRDAISKDLERLQEETKTINRGSIDLTNQQSELDIVSETARKIGAEVEAMEVELQAPPRVRVVDRATLPVKKDEYRRIKAGGVSAAGSFALVVFLVSFWEFRSRRINTVDQVVHGLGMRMVGTLPSLPNLVRRQGELAEKRLQSLLVESVDAARAVLLHAARVENIRLVLITSAVQGEGKTSLACQLATSLARTGRKTLLLDCDLRCPATHTLFDYPQDPGLSEVLRGELAADEAIRKTLAAGLHLLTAGRSDSVAVQALAQDRIRTLLEELRTRYDFVIVDSPPVLSVADTLHLGQVVDAVIFSILHDVSRIPLVYSAYERLEALGARMLGAIVNGAPMDPGKSDYGYRTPTGQG